jgi:hypothetical protein
LPEEGGAAGVQKSYVILLFSSSEFPGLSAEKYRWTLLPDFADKNLEHFTET